jgi:transposase
MLMPASLQDWLGPKHLARFVVDCVESLNLTRIEASYAGRGERPYRPKMLIALLFYGYATGVFSSRKLERACFDSVVFRYIAANTSPDHDTIADFRRRALPYLPDIFVQILLIAKELDMLKVGQISLDGTKVKASASKHRSLSYAHAGKIKAKLRREVAQLMKRAEQSESEPEPDLDIPAEIARREARIARIDQARATIAQREAERHAVLKAAHLERLQRRREYLATTGKLPKGPRPKLPPFRVNPKAQVNLTDEDSRIMPTANGFEQGYNAQACVDMNSRLIVSCSVTQATNDKQQIQWALDELLSLPSALGKVEALAADAGYCSAANVQRCEDAGVVPYLSLRRERHNSWLSTQSRKPDGELGPDATGMERMKHRLQTKAGRALYGERKSTVETTFGIVKSANGFRAFMLRGLPKVRGEWTLACAAYDLKMLCNLVAACSNEAKAA